MALIRELVALGRRAGSLGEVAHAVARGLVHELGFEQVVVVLTGEGTRLAPAGRYSQGERLGGPVEAVPDALVALADEVRRAEGLVRFGGEGVGARRPLPIGLAGAVIGLPLALGDTAGGAVLCVELAPRPFDLTRQHALAIVGDIVGQVMTLVEGRLGMGAVQRDLETALGATRGELDRHAASAHLQSDRIGALTTALVASKRAKESFLALMSHELRTPLSVILGFGSMLKDGHVGALADPQREYLDRMVANGRHLHRLVEDMLFFVDAETAEIAVRRTEVDLAALVAEVASTIPGLGAPGAPVFRAAIAADVAEVASDPALLRRVVFHVLSNAAKFTARGEIVLDATRTADGSAIVLRIRDTGRGVSPEQHERIFEIFRQGDETQVRRHDGLGLGLNLVRACLRLLGGRFTLGPAPGGGTEVEMIVPDGAGRTAALPDARVPARGGERSGRAVEAVAPAAAASATRR